MVFAVIHVDPVSQIGLDADTAQEFEFPPFPQHDDFYTTPYMPVSHLNMCMPDN